ncbi:MAG: fused MFS/spermidine synthase [bacterium]
MNTILCLIFFLSGASALIFESLWFQLCGLSFGNSIWAVSFVLTAFMGGLAIGNGITILYSHKISSPIKLYSFLELIIGFSGLFIVLFFPHFTKLLIPFFNIISYNHFLINTLRAVTPFIFLLIPTTAMGATLPILVKAAYRKESDFSNILGLLYGWNTFGSVIGVIICELFLIKFFGIKSTAVIAASFNFLAALGGFLLSKIYTKNKRLPNPIKKILPQRIIWPSYKLLSASFLFGFIFLALEVTWFRFMSLFFNAYSWFFACMLAIVLGGISLGGFIASQWGKLKTDLHINLHLLCLANSLLIVISYNNFEFIYRQAIKYGSEYIAVVFSSIFLMLPISICSGIIFTFLGKILYKHIREQTQAAGFLTISNTLGAALGSLIGGLCLIPLFGIEKSFFILTCMYGVVSFFLKKPRTAPDFLNYNQKFKLFTLIFIIILIIFPFNLIKKTYFNIPIKHYLKIGEKILSIHEDTNETLQYLEFDLLDRPYYHRLVTNNHTMADTKLRSKRYMKFFVYLPIAIHPEPKNALLICYGLGNTAKALTDSKNLASIEIVDISQQVIKSSEEIFPSENDNPIHDQRVKIHIEDGRFFLLSSNKKFDIITAEPPPPKNEGIVNLYTQEYFELIYKRLSEGGIVTYWLPIALLEINEAKSIIKSFCNVFENACLFSAAGQHWTLMGIKPPFKTTTADNFIRQWTDPEVSKEMKNLGFISPEQFGSTFIAGPQRLNQWVKDSLPLPDNYPQRILQTRTGYSDLSKYWAFRNPEIAGKDFKNSKLIRQLWPKQISAKTEKYFNSSKIIDEILLHQYPICKYLHKCIQNPLLNNYLLWTLFSDLQAYKIISDSIPDDLTFKEMFLLFIKNTKFLISRKNRGQLLQNLEIGKHLAAYAVLNKQYLLAEKFYGLISQFASKQKIEQYFFLRMYLLMKANQKNKAEILSKQYINADKRYTDKRTEEVTTFWNWASKALE